MTGIQESQKSESVPSASPLIGIGRERKPRYKRNPINRELTYERLRKLLVYNPETGKFYNRVRRGSQQAGTEAGCINSRGYLQISTNKKIYLAHRLAWLYVYGYMPENYLDHIDRDPNNNRIENLREVSHSCNLRNCDNRADNTSGVKGVRWVRPIGKWVATITADQRRIWLGQYADYADAACARLAAEQCLSWEGCDSSSPAYRYVRENIV